MTDEQYTATQQMLIYFYQQLILIDFDLDGFLQRISVAHAVAPILDPTSYIKAFDNLQEIRDLAVALRPAVELAKRMRGAMS